MNIKVEKTEKANEVKISFKIEAEKFEDAMKKVYSKSSKYFAIPGFRKGKAPYQIVEKKYGPEIFYEDAFNDLVPGIYEQALKDNKVEAVSNPEIDVQKMEKGSDLEFTAVVQTKPEVKLGKYKGIELKKVEYNVSDEDVNHELKHMQEHNARVITVEDRAAKDKDIAVIDFEGFVDGKAFEGGKAEKHELELGSHSFIPGFEEQLLGHKKGENFEIKVKFPEQYYKEDLRGKNAIFKITINDIYVKEIPELNDDLAKSLGFANLDKMKDLICGNLKNMFEGRMKNVLKDKIFTAIVEKNKIDLPDSIIEKEIDEKVENEKEKNKDNKNWDEKKAKKDIEKNIRKSYSGFYLIESIAERNAIDVSDDEIKQVAMQDAVRGGMDVKSVLQQLEKNDKMKNYIYFTLKEAKVFDFIFAKIKKNVKKLDKEAFEKYLKEENEKRNNQ